MSIYNFLDTSKYYCTLTLMDYERVNPFEPSPPKNAKFFRLPLPMELRDDLGVSYQNTDLNAIGDMINGAGNVAAGAALRNAGDIAKAGAQGVAGFMQGAGNALGGKAGGAMNIAGTVGSKLANQIDASAVSSAASQGLGVAANPNPSVAFQGPILRDFSMSWTFYPTNAKNSATIQSMIKTLKGAAAAQYSGGGASAVLGYPKLVQLNFYPWDKGGSGPHSWSNKSIIRLKRCFMASVNASYNAGSAPSFFTDSTPTVTTLSINFKEVEYMLSTDYGTTGSYSQENIESSIEGGIAAQPPADQTNPAQQAAQT